MSERPLASKEAASHQTTAATTTTVRNPCCRAAELVNTTVVEQLLDIASFRSLNEKSPLWMKGMRYLWIQRDDPRILRLAEGPLVTFERRNYIAVSYSWAHTPSLERDVSGSYLIVDHRGGAVRQSRVRDEALLRVIRYANYHNIPRFWIDQECNPKAGSEEFQNAMDSMDLVYQRSASSVGLLAVWLETQDQVNTLQRLLLGSLIAPRHHDQYPKLASSVREKTIKAVLQLLGHLLRDRWWTRAWVFQEEYLASWQMHLLVRRKPRISALRQFGFLEGEICIEAVRFREQSTLFLLACKRHLNSILKKKCAILIKRVGKYNVQYCFQHDSRRKAMSPRVYADIQRRNSRSEFDRLPIAANSCNYAIRLRSNDLAATGHSPGLCLLAMYLLNGEILRNAREITRLPTEMDVCNYLQYISFNKFDPPVQEKHLTYLKECRLHPVTLCRQGISTEGHLWTITNTFRTKYWTRPRWSRKLIQMGLNNFQRDTLHQLSCKMRCSGSALKWLAMKIDGYLTRDALGTTTSSAKEHMDLMAETVVEAIRLGESLFVANAYKSSEAAGIFVNLRHPGMSVFTSWHDGVDVDGRYRKSHVSLGVNVSQARGGPLLETLQWVNGLVFFEQQYQAPVVFTWPRAWTQGPV